MLTPLDIQNKEFKREFRGYAMSEVDEFLNRIIEGYEKLYKTNMDSRDKITMLEETIKQYKTMEETLQNTLIVAQSTGDQIQKNAQEKADNIIKEAHNKAREIVASSYSEMNKLTYQYEELKRGMDVYRAKMTALLESQLGILKKVESADETFAEIKNMQEALQAVEEAETEIAAQAVGAAPVQPTLEETRTFSMQKAGADEEGQPHNYDTQEIEYLLNIDEKTALE